MVEFRRMQHDDLEAVYRFTVEGLRAHLYPLHLAPERVRAIIRHFIDTPQDFHLAAFDGPVMVGGVGAAVSPMLYFERCEATVVMCRAVQPGVGRHLLTEMMTWARSDMRIKRVLFPMEFDAPRAMARYLRSLGFEQPQGLAVAFT
jgi:hypothetical protein